jgi:hypothetical protein
MLLGVLFLPATAKEAVPGSDGRLNSKCNAPAGRDFDFWIGTWDLRVRQRIGIEGDEYRDGRAVSIVRPILDGCVLLEEFDGDQLPRPVVGISVSTFNSRTGRWQQTWVDNSANNMVFQGGYAGDHMEMIHKAEEGGDPVLWRITFYNVHDDEFDWAYDRSTDGGKTWLNFMEIHYTRNTDEPIV